MNSEAYQTLLWQERDLKDLYTAIDFWESLEEEGQLSVSAEQVIQWGGAWRVWEHKRWMLLMVLEAYLPSMETHDAQKFWDVLASTKNEPEIHQMMVKFLEMGHSGSYHPASVYAGRMVFGNMDSEGRFNGVEAAVEFARNKGGQDEVDNLIVDKAGWIMSVLTGHTSGRSRPEPNIREKWGRVLDHLSPQARAQKLIGPFIHLWLHNYGWGYSDSNSCAILVQEAAERGMDLNELLLRFQDMEGRAKDDRLGVVFDELLTLGADWKVIDMEKASDLIRKTIQNHPAYRRESLMRNTGKITHPSGKPSPKI